MENKKEFLKEFLSFLPLAVCFANSEGYILEVNERMEKLLNYKRHELVDDNLEKIFPKEEVEKILRKDFRRLLNCYPRALPLLRQN